MMLQFTPISFGYKIPAEWEPHRATWLTFPWLDDSFPGRLPEVYPFYFSFIKAISLSEKVAINVPNEEIKQFVIDQLIKYKIDINQIELYLHPSNDVWCRDHGPAFVINNKIEQRKAIINWEFNAWGGKYDAKDDNLIPRKIADHFRLPFFSPGIIMEGGSVDFNGAGTVITTTQCLLNKNRNPHLSQGEIEEYLKHYYGVEQVLWLHDGIAGDDTDGHVDDITRFVSSHTIVTAVESNISDENYGVLKENLQSIKTMRLLDGKQPDIIELPMPDPLYYGGRRLPASYANFYFTNSSVIVPVFNCSNDAVALKILEQAIPDKKIIPIDSREIVWGLGSFHCLSQQEPM